MTVDARADDVALEMELRRLPGALCVGFGRRGGTLEVQVVLRPDTDFADARSKAEAICRRLIPSGFELSITGDARPERVRLLDVAVRPDERGLDEVEVHLAFGTTRTIGRAHAGGAADAARATVAALERLGARVPFEVEGATVVDDRRGDAVMLVLAEAGAGAGARYGAAAGRTIEHAAARATLHALNRHLSTQRLAG